MKKPILVLGFLAGVLFVGAFIQSAWGVLPGEERRPETPRADANNWADAVFGPDSSAVRKIEELLRGMSIELANLEVAWMEESRMAAAERKAAKERGKYAIADLEFDWMSRSGAPSKVVATPAVAGKSAVSRFETPWMRRIYATPKVTSARLVLQNFSMANVEAAWMRDFNEPGKTMVGKTPTSGSLRLADMEDAWMNP